MWTIWVCSSLLFGYVPGADHPSEKLYSLTRVCTLISVILNMLALDSYSPINCQVCIISPGSPYTRADRQYLDKAMGYLSSCELFLSDKDPRLRTCSVVIFLLGLCSRVSSNRNSDVRLFFLLFAVQTFRMRTHM